MNKLVLLLTVILSNEIFAAGDGAHGSVTDLLFPAINFTILFVGLLFVSKKPLKEMFDTNAKQVADLYEYADKRDKEANLKLEMYQKKMGNLESEKNKIVENAEKEAKEFISNAEKESNAYLARLERDAANKIESEKTSLENLLKEDLVSEVIAKAKEKISSDSSLNRKATEKLISQI